MPVSFSQKKTHNSYSDKGADSLPALKAISPWSDFDKLRFCREQDFRPRPFTFFISSLNSRTFPKTSPFILCRLLQSSLLYHSHLDDVRFSRSGLLLLKTFDYDCAEEVLRLSHIGSVQVSSRLAADSVQTDFLIRNVDVGISVEEILKWAQHDNIRLAEVRRFTRNMNGVRKPSTTVLLSIIGRNDMSSVTIYFKKYHCSLFIPRPRACSICQVFGHSAKTCQGKPRCARCAGSHLESSCSATSVCCCRCGGPHTSNDSTCPKYQEEASLLQRCATDRMPFSSLLYQQKALLKSYRDDSFESVPESFYSSSHGIMPHSVSPLHSICQEETAAASAPYVPSFDWEKCFQSLEALEHMVQALTIEVRELQELIVREPPFDDSDTYCYRNRGSN